MVKLPKEYLIKTNNPPTKLYSLLKFGKEEHIKDLYENGNLYLSSVKDFINSDIEDHRFDSYEGATRLINSLPGIIPIKVADGKTVDLKYEKIHIKETDEIINHNICSFFAVITENVGNGMGLNIDNKMKEFGTHVILIYNYSEFLNRLRNAIDKIRIDYRHGLVEYYDESTYNGDLTLFHKRNKYQYQVEYRIHLLSGFAKPYTINLGNLKDIAMFGRSNDIEKLKINPID